MKNTTILLTALVLACAFSFAFDESVFASCGVSENNCMQQCCQSAGGTYTSSGDYGDCMGETENPEAAEAAYMDCTINACRPQLINCVAPSSSCAGDYTSCLNSCKAGGADSETCDGACFEETSMCVADYLAAAEGAPATSGTSTYAPTTSSDGSCCGSAFLLAFALLGAFAARKI